MKAIRALLALWTIAATAAQADHDLPPVTITATTDARDPYDVPASVDSIDVRETPRLGASVAELLDGVTGVVARDRRNYAQDTQIAIRGYGARSTFGVRGLRLYVDGIPATQPDGQGQTSHIDLASAGRIEVLRGPFAAQYGNASGGVVQVYTEEPDAPWRWRVGGFGDDSGAQRVAASTGGARERVDYHAGYSQFRTDGARPHAAARRDVFNARLGVDIGAATRITIVGNALQLPYAQDPLGLTREQFERDPQQTAAVATQFDTRKRVVQSQVGTIVETAVDERNRLRAMVYGGRRDILQYLAIPAAAQAAPTHAGGVVDLDSGYAGADLRWNHTATLAGRPLAFGVGVAYDDLRQHRRGYENFVGATTGVRGRLRRDEINRAYNVDPYAQAEWRIADAWSALVGVRRSRVAMRSDDRYVTAGNADDSGSTTYARTTPTAGVTYRVDERLAVYAAYGRGFETPTLAELAYRADGAAGLAFGLAPTVSTNREAGLKWRGDRGNAQFALFRSDAVDDLAVATSTGGRTTYRNIGGSRRRGAELSVAFAHDERWQSHLALSYLDAQFTRAFLGCSARCTQPDTPVAAGARIPGVPRAYATLSTSWQPSPQRWRYGAELAASTATKVDDVGAAYAPGYALLGVRAERRWRTGDGELRVVTRIDNLAGRAYVGSVIVNDANGRYYEPGLGRTFTLGVEWSGGSD